jgi:hypothetical protein
MLALLLLALAAVGVFFYFRRRSALARKERFLARGASSLTPQEIADARASMRQPRLGRGSFRSALDMLVFDGLAAGGDTDYTEALPPGARAGLARQIALDAELALALAATEDELAAVADFGARVARTRLGAGAAAAAEDAGDAAARAAETRAAAVRVQRDAGEVSGAAAAAIILDAGARHRSDPQNVHDAGVVDSLQAAARRLVREHGVPSPDACVAAERWAAAAADAAFSAGPEASPAKLAAARRCLASLRGDSSVSAGERPLTLPQVLALVRARAEDPANAATRAMIAENTAKALAESAGTCPTGRTSAILGALTLNDGLFVPPETQEQVRNDALAAAREAGLAAARALAAGGGPLASAAANFIDPRSAPDPPPGVADELGRVLATAAAGAAIGLGKKFMMRPPALAQLEADVRAAYA